MTATRARARELAVSLFDRYVVMLVLCSSAASFRRIFHVISVHRLPPLPFLSVVYSSSPLFRYFYYSGSAGASAILSLRAWDCIARRISLTTMPDESRQSLSVP